MNRSSLELMAALLADTCKMPRMEIAGDKWISPHSKRTKPNKKKKGKRRK